MRSISEIVKKHCLNTSVSNDEKRDALTFRLPDGQEYLDVDGEHDGRDDDSCQGRGGDVGEVRGEEEASCDHNQPSDDAAEGGLYPAGPVDGGPAERRRHGEGAGERTDKLADAQGQDLLGRVDALGRC